MEDVEPGAADTAGTQRGMKARSNQPGSRGVDEDDAGSTARTPRRRGSRGVSVVERRRLIQITSDRARKLSSSAQSARRRGDRFQAITFRPKPGPRYGRPRTDSAKPDDAERLAEQLYAFYGTEVPTRTSDRWRAISRQAAKISARACSVDSGVAVIADGVDLDAALGELGEVDVACGPEPSNTTCFSAWQRRRVRSARGIRRCICRSR